MDFCCQNIKKALPSMCVSFHDQSFGIWDLSSRRDVFVSSVYWFYFSLDIVSASWRLRVDSWGYECELLPVVSSSSSSSEHLHFVAWLLLIHNLKFSTNYTACTDESVVSAMAVNFFI